MKRLAACLACILLLALAVLATPASAAFGLKEVSVEFTDEAGAPALQAGSHPFAMSTTIAVNSTQIPEGGSCVHPICEVPDGAVEDLRVSMPAGFAGDPKAVPRCSAADFSEVDESIHTACPDATAVGLVALKFDFQPFPIEEDAFLHVPVYNLAPPPGMAARLGFVVLRVPVTIDVGLNPNPPYNVEAHPTNIAQAAHFYSSVLSLWGDPGSPAHDPVRGHCLKVDEASPVEEPISQGKCPLDSGERKAFLTVPRSCSGPLRTDFFALAWNTGEEDSQFALTEPGMIGCPKLDFGPRISAQPTSDRVSAPSGLDFNLQIEDEGLTNPNGLAQSDIKEARVTLPEGVTINPSQAEGLAVCSEAQLAKETPTSPFGAGCPPASKIGSVETESPLLEGEVLKGSLFVATPFENLAADSLIAFYIVIKQPELGIVVTQAAKVEPDPKTGQLITTTEDMPQLPFSDFRLHFREGGRSPLITPELCGTYETEALFTPWANPASPLLTTSSFQITRGIGGGPCPPGGVPPFAPGFSAGTLNNDGGSFSPFYMRLTRRDGDQDMTKFSTVLPPGLLGKLAGLSRCPEASIAAAKAKSGKAELASPSCPATSQIGRTIAGAGVGSQLTYVPGKLYLAGPVGPSPLSVVAITPALAGPFDVGTVVVRVALTLNPKSAEVEIDGANSDPIPHILAGIPLKVRDLRVYADRPNFTLNPTSCDPFQTKATLFGSFANLFSAADDVPVSLASHFQAANCANLGFKPRLSFKLKGGTKRGGHPAVRAQLRPRPGDANFAKAIVRLPRSAFLDQGHIGTVCTRVQFAANACPKGAIYGHIRAFSPLLEEPLEGPAYLRSSDNLLPDMVFDLHGLVDVEAAARIDSIKGGIRLTFADIPDAPISKVIASFPGGRKGLIVNSRDLCAAPSRAKVRFEAQNAKRAQLSPLLRAAGCR